MRGELAAVLAPRLPTHPLPSSPPPSHELRLRELDTLHSALLADHGALQKQLEGERKMWLRERDALKLQIKSKENCLYLNNVSLPPPSKPPLFSPPCMIS